LPNEEYSDDAKSIIRRNALNECSQPIGQINVAIKGLPGFQTISFYCNQPKLHSTPCSFVTKDVVVLRRSR